MDLHKRIHGRAPTVLWSTAQTEDAAVGKGRKKPRGGEPLIRVEARGFVIYRRSRPPNSRARRTKNPDLEN